MAGPSFADLVSRLVESMGQQLSSVRRGPEGLLLRTNDGFLFAFLEDPSVVSLDVIRRLLDQVGPSPRTLVVLTPGRLPLALQAELLQKGATVVDSARFSELVRGLGLASYLGDGPPPEPTAKAGRLLPSARQLDEIMHRAQHWLGWGVPALALRFFRQAAASKPEFLPARDGIGRSLLGLGLVDDADRTFDEVLASHPDDVEARLGKAAVLSARGRVADEVAIYRELLAANPQRIDVRTHLVAALIDEGEWSAARSEVETILAQSPEDPYFRFLHSATLARTGASDESLRERDRARSLGLPPERERSLCEHLGLPVPDFPTPEPDPVAPRAAIPSPAPPKGRMTPVLPLAAVGAVSGRPRAGTRSAARRPPHRRAATDRPTRAVRKPKKRRSA
ncbi:MAG: tetratricopeptide repeat protein [Thermoplasmata archaeon]